MPAARRLSLLAALTLAAAACQTQAPPPKELATDQTLRIAIPVDISPRESLDPAQIADPLGYAIGNNLFGGLYRFDDELKERPDIAAGMPDVSPDGRTYTFHLLENVTFSNGDPVTGGDFVYSWNRAAQAQGDLADAPFGPIDGYRAIVAAVAAVKPAPSLSLSAPNPHTLIVHLSAPAPGWLATLALPPAWVIDQRAVEAYGQAAWWSIPGGLVGTGPFQLTARTLKESLVFTRTQHWWGGSTGALTRVELHVISGVSSQWQAYRAGRVDVLGFGVPENGSGVPELASSQVSELENLSSDSAHRGEIHAWSFGRTEWVGFKFQGGPLLRGGRSRPAFGVRPGDRPVGAGASRVRARVGLHTRNRRADREGPRRIPGRRSRPNRTLRAGKGPGND